MKTFILSLSKKNLLGQKEYSTFFVSAQSETDARVIAAKRGYTFHSINEHFGVTGKHTFLF